MPSSRDLFEILAREHTPMLRAFLLSLVRDASAADDIAQETLLVAWKTLDRFDHTRPFAPWLRGIAAKLVLNWRRTNVRKGLVLVDEPTLEALDRRFQQLDAAPGDTWDERTAALRGCLAELEAEDRQVIDLRYDKGLECAGIAETVKQGVEWVKKRLQRARARLAQCVTGRLAATERT